MHCFWRKNSSDNMQSLGMLRNIHDSELALMLSWRNAPSVRENMYTRHEISMEEHTSWWEKNSLRKDQQYYMYEYSGRPQGIVAFTGIDHGNKNSSWAFYAAPDAQRGTGLRMEFLALEHAFSDLALHKLSCEVLAFNTSVIKLHQRFGFKVEGIFREQHLIDATAVDVYRLAILESEWQQQRDLMADKITSHSSRTK